MPFDFFWVLWLIGILVPFGFKLGNHLFKTTPAGTSYGSTLRNFVFADAEASTKTFINLIVELLIGAVYIDKLQLPYVHAVDLPRHWALALALSAGCELAVPWGLTKAIAAAKAKIEKKFSV